VRIVTFRRITEFCKLHPDADVSLRQWYHVVSKEEWSNLNDVRNIYNSVDYVGNHRYVFNLKVNHYRLVAIISFNAKKVYIRFIGTHKEYDKINDIKNI